jgi:hypothetical protein
MTIMPSEEAAAAWLQMAQGVSPLSGDGARLTHHWRTDDDLLARAIASYDMISDRPFFDQAFASFDRMVRQK